jgi:flagellar biosynthesis anti-sigma factor FlgM
MKISKIRGRAIGGVYSDKSAPVESRSNAEPASKSSVSKADNIAISRESRLMAKAGQIISQGEEIRMEKVQPLATAVKENTYEVEPRKVADSIIANLLTER